MQAVNIRTTQNVQLEYPLAGVAERLLAFVIDAIIMGSFYFVLLLLLGSFNQELPLTMSLILGIIAYLYRFLMELLFNGQTIGKMALNLKVVKLDGSTPSVAAYLLRWLLEPIDFGVSGLAVLLIILTRNGQRLGDLLGGTTVVKVKRVSANQIQQKTVIANVEDDYEPTFPDAASLTDHELRLIKAALNAYRDDAKPKPMRLLETKIKEKYQIESELPTIKFLYTLIRDHAYYVSQ